MMTLHSAKGLEFPTVIMAGVEEKLFPHTLAVEDEDIEEERRLCYVGMTRAKSRLYFTFAAQRRVFGEYRSTGPSRFLMEVPEDLIEVVSPSGYRDREASLPFGAHSREAYSGRASSGSAHGGRGRSGRPHAGGAHFTRGPFDEGRTPAGRGQAGGSSPREPHYVFDGDQDPSFTLAPGRRVRHPQLGTGIVLSIEPVDDDIRLVVRFESVGRKTLRAKFAHLEPA